MTAPSVGATRTVLAARLLTGSVRGLREHIESATGPQQDSCATATTAEPGNSPGCEAAADGLPVRTWPGCVAGALDTQPDGCACGARSASRPDATGRPLRSSCDLAQQPPARPVGRDDSAQRPQRVPAIKRVRELKGGMEAGVAQMWECIAVPQPERASGASESRNSFRHDGSAASGSLFLPRSRSRRSPRP
jgi:hypothetical protein